MDPAYLRKTRARIAYRGADNKIVGEEYLALTTHKGGHILQASCEMHDVGLLRDVSLSMQPDWRPIDGFCRITRHGETEAVMWFDVNPEYVDVHGRIEGDGFSLHLPQDQPLPYLGLHPLQGDALISHVRGKDAIGEFRAIEGLTNSISPDGDEHEGVTPVSIDVAYYGEESLTVTAGTFAASRYALRWSPDWPPADLWVRAEDGLFLQMRWSFVERWYELVELSEQEIPNV